jgi:Icc-related predicted phosphoesterase
MKYLIAVLLLSLSVFLLIFAQQFSIEVSDTSTRKQLRDPIGNEFKELLWFLQISDIHISKFKDPTRVSDFKRFCSEVVDAVKPQVVIASGDLTDAKDEILGSQQFAEEWKAYYQSLVESNVLNKTTFMDIRGNHDNFNVEFLNSNADLFKNFSAQGKHHKRSYLKQIEVDGVKYNFVALDASIEPGSKRPYNFIGMIPKEELIRVEKLVKDSPANYTVWFAHYPTSTIITPAGFDHIRKFIGNFNHSSIFVAGHLHTLGSLVFRMYTLQPEGFLELELGDFMKNRLFRLGVFDHGLFSFADVKLGTWPIAVITNPKDIHFNNPFKENIEIQRSSTHIRIVAFSTSPITQCKIRIDDGEWEKCEKQTENFFTVPWVPSRYLKGKHNIELLVGDADGRIFNHDQLFALDGTRVNFDFLAKFILMSDVTTIFQVGFFVAFVICLLPLLVFKIWQFMIKCKSQIEQFIAIKIVRKISISDGKLKRPKVASHYWRGSIQKYLVLASVDRIYFTILFWLLYTAIGPWSFHEILDGHIGVVFVWGTFVKGQFVPGTLNWW